MSTEAYPPGGWQTDAATASAGDINSDVEIVGAQKVQEALEQVAALIAAAVS